MLSVLGLQAHEEVEAYVDRAGVLQTVVPHSVVAALVYRCDIRTQFKQLPHIDMSGPGPGHGGGGGGSEDGGDAGDAGDGTHSGLPGLDVDAKEPGGDRNNTLQAILNTCAFEHFRASSDVGTVCNSEILLHRGCGRWEFFQSFV